MTGHNTQINDLLPCGLEDKFDLSKERVFITGTQALVRLCLTQSQRDKKNGLNTAGYITGYRGSPLGALDQQFPRAKAKLDEANIIFEPGLNEDLAATAIWGTQQAELRGEGEYDGVFGMWYGKGPGVDRSGDVFRHANLAGTSKNGGVLVLMGDDHTCESSTTAHQSEYALVDAMIPIMNPASIQEIVEYGLHGWALSRYAGVWCGLKGVKDNVESTASVDLNFDAFEPVIPTDFKIPEDGLNIRMGDIPQVQEARLHQHKIEATKAYLRANPINRTIFSGGKTPRIGIVSTGKSYLDTCQALESLGINEEVAAKMGLSMYKVGMSWPLEPHGIAEFAEDLDLMIVVEEKRGLIEDQARALLYGKTGMPQIIGKRDENGKVLFQSEAALNPVQIATAIGQRLLANTQHLAESENIQQLQQRFTAISDALKSEREALAVQRRPYFCAGCPHNSSTVVPEGMRAYAGIGCHYMVLFMDRNTEGYTHMGGEGANWIGESKFSKRKHVFQNIGDGTFNHSGIMAIRAAVGSNTNMTYKILYNDAVAMTGGQGHDGDLTIYDMANEVAAAGVKKIALVSDNPDEHKSSQLPSNTKIYHRERLISVQKELAKVDGVSVLLYEQTCAAEKRRRRKRGLMVDPPKRAFINEAVCEGCGDCGVQSNCVAILPLETDFGRKRKIDQSACNKDFSCVNGFCPSFVTIEGGELRKPEIKSKELPAVPEPDCIISLDKPFAIALTGVGGTGVVTIGALLGMAAHLEGKGCGIIDMAGLAQKGGAVVSHIKLAAQPEAINTIRIAAGGADLVLGCDLLVSASDLLLDTVKKQTGYIIANTNEMLTGDFTRDVDFKLPTSIIHHRIKTAVPDGHSQLVNATQHATSLLGDSIGANLFILGVAYQSGLIPLSSAAIEKAIEMNGVAVSFSKQAFHWGRVWSNDRSAIEALSPETTRPESQAINATMIGIESPQTNTTPAATLTDTPDQLDAFIEKRMKVLTQYQNAKYAKRYQTLVNKIVSVDQGAEKQLSFAAARYAFKLMAYKDEYEVARLYTDGRFEEKNKQQFSGDYKLTFHLAPPIISKIDADSGKVKKRTFGPWMMSVFRQLAKLKSLRGTPLDIFGYSAERKIEKSLIKEYSNTLADVASRYDQIDYQKAVDLLSLPELVRGYGHVKLKSIETYKEAMKDTNLRPLEDSITSNSKAA
jgi:indolepyruvate ferredoxin oxidoreductase